MRKLPLYRAIAQTLQARLNCERAGNAEWRDRHQSALDQLVRDFMPSGSGFDCGTQLDPKSTPDRLQFIAPFHHMDDVGSYDGWTDHVFTVRASLSLGIVLTISGRDRDGFKDYAHEAFYFALLREVTQGDDGAWKVAEVAK